MLSSKFLFLDFSPCQIVRDEPRRMVHLPELIYGLFCGNKKYFPPRKTLRLPLIILSCQLVVAMPFTVLLLHHPLVNSLRQLVVALPLLFLSLRPAPPSHPLVAQAGCCIASQRPVLCLSCCLIVLSCHLSLSCRASWLLHHYLSLSSYCTSLSSSHCAGWLLRCLSLRCPLVLSSQSTADTIKHCQMLLPPSNTTNAVSIIHLCHSCHPLPSPPSNTNAHFCPLPPSNADTRRRHPSQSPLLPWQCLSVVPTAVVVQCCRCH